MLTEKLWDVWLHNGVDRNGKELPYTRIDNGNQEYPEPSTPDRGEHQLHTGEAAFAFAFAHPEPAVLIVCDPSGECTVVQIKSAERSIPFRGGHSDVPETYVHGN